MPIEVKSLLVVALKLFLRYLMPRILEILAHYDDDEIARAATLLKAGTKPPPPL